jgi:hypothetical protein
MVLLLLVGFHEEERMPHPKGVNSGKKINGGPFVPQSAG